MEEINYQNININNIFAKEVEKLPTSNRGYSIFYSLENNASICINGSIIKLKENNALFLNEGIIHSAYVSEESKLYEFRFASKTISTSLSSDKKDGYIDPTVFNESLDYILLGPRSKNYVSLISCLDKLIEIENEKSEFYDYDVMKCLYSIWSIITQNTSNAIYSRKKKDYQMAIGIMDYIKENYAKKIRMPEISKIEQASLATCYRCFKSLTGYSIHQYIKMYRLCKSMYTLLSTKKKASLIAIENGFVGKNQFTYQFKKELGFTPIAFRNNIVSPTDIIF